MDTVVFTAMVGRISWPAIVGGTLGSQWTEWMPLVNLFNELNANTSDHFELEYLYRCPICGKEIAMSSICLEAMRVKAHLIDAHGLGEWKDGLRPEMKVQVALVHSEHD